MTGIDRERMLREAYPDPEERLRVRLEQGERKARELGEAVGKVPPPRPNRHGKFSSPLIKARPTPEEKARWQSIADEEGVPLSEWIVEACRAYELLGKRKDGVLTDADWRRVVGG